MIELKENTVFVVFYISGDRPLWYHRFCKKPFYHCATLRAIHNNYQDFFISIDSTIHGAFTELFNLGDRSHKEILDTLKRVHTEKNKIEPIILKYDVDVDNKKSMVCLQNMFPTCVTLTKVFLRVRSFAFTPYMLYKVLLKKGAVRI